LQKQAPEDVLLGIQVQVQKATRFIAVLMISVSFGCKFGYCKHSAYQYQDAIGKHENLHVFYDSKVQFRYNCQSKQ
jgi:hypothetical protein